MKTLHRLVLVMTALFALIALSLVMLAMEQTVTAIVMLIPAICMGVQQIVHASVSSAAIQQPTKRVSPLRNEADDAAVGGEQEDDHAL